ncbi:MAG: tyrosine-type recombinase/integrase [Fimbriimonadaceae bacterium]|nr:tyrosine-type recombinase/integrase [Fimbriimonadaceae bacterium]
MANRADDHDGSCREVLTGKHAGKWRVQFTHVSGSGLKSRLSRIFPTKTEAKTFLQSLRRGERAEAARNAREATFGEWFEWLAENDWPQTLAGITIAQRQARFRKYASKHFKHRPLSTIDALQVRAFYRELQESGCSASLVLSVKADLVRAFNQAITPYQRLPMTIANPFRLPLPQPEVRNAVALTPAEVKAALASNIEQDKRAMLALFLLAGVRLGEQMAMTRGQLRFESNLIVIDRAVRVEYGGKQSVGLPKGGKTRCAVMCQTLEAILAPFVAEMALDDVLWPAMSENKPRMKKLVYATWRTIRKAAQLPEEMSPHDCRLTHINIIEKLMPSVSETTLKEHVGHAATGVTQANYTRPITPAQEILRAELDRVLG